MADANQAAEELAQALAKVNKELADLGRVSHQTQSEIADANLKAKYGIENYTKGTAKAAEGVMALGGAAAQAGRAMLDGKKGAAAFNSSLDELATAAQAAGAALALLVPGGILIKGLIAGITAATTAFIKYEQAANEMSDKLHKSYQGLAKAGGAAADGMTGVFKDAKKLGLSMNELDQMVSLVAENGKDFALFAGSVSEGRKRFADLSQAMAPARLELMNMGMSMQEINEGAAGYIRLQSRVGATQNKTTQELAESTKKYLVEQDALTKLTGMTRQDQEKSREEIRSQERFAAKLEEVRQTRGEAAAKALEDTYLILKSKSREAAQGFADLSTGMITTEAARKQNMSDQGESLRQSRLIIEGQQSSAGAAQEIAKVSGATAKNIGTSLALLGVNNSIMSDYAGGLALGAAAAGDGIKKAAQKIEEDAKRQGAGADKITNEQNKLILTQMEANKELEKTVFEGIPTAQKNMQTLANAALAAAKALGRLATDEGMSAEEAQRKKSTDEAKKQGLVNDALTNNYGMDFGQLSAAEGGIFKGPSTGYPVLMHGTEAIIPMDKMTGANKMGGLDQFGAFNKSVSTITDKQGLENSDAEKMERFAKSMLKDTEQLTKITDSDLKRTKNFGLLQTKLFEKKTALMEDELELLDEQNEILEKMLEIAEKAGGKDAAAAMKRSFTMARMGMGGGGAGGALGSGMQMPGMANNMPSMGGAQGLKGPEEHQAVGQGGQGIKGPPKLATIRSKTGKSTSVNAEYAQRFQGLIDYLDSVGYEINSLGGYVDRDVRGKPGVKSVHAHGGAIDINPGANPMGGQLITDMPENISAIAKQLGLGWGGNWASVKDAMHFSVAANEGGDIKLSEGGVAVGPNGGYPATLHGEEAVIPLNNGGGNFIKMFEAMAEGNSKMVAMMEEMVRAQKNSVDVQNKMLRAQS